MTRDEFEMLAAKVLAAEATPEEAARLEAALAEDARLESEFSHLRATWSALHEFGLEANAVHAKPILPPAKRTRGWENVLAEKHGAITARSRSGRSFDEPFTHRPASAFTWQLAVAASILLAAAVAVTLWLRPAPNVPSGSPVAYLVQHKGAAQFGNRTIKEGQVTHLGIHDSIRLPERSTATLISTNGAIALRGPITIDPRHPPGPGNAIGASETNTSSTTVQTALFGAPQQALGLLLTTRGARGIRVYSPAGFTASSNPLILWKAEPGKTYDLSITDELNPTAPGLRLAAATSPIEFSRAWAGRTLTNDGLYRLMLSETGKPVTASEVVFRVLPGPYGTIGSSNIGSEKLVLAYQVLSTTPAYLGDALSALLTLPPELAGSELALRLKLFAFGQLGFDEDFNATLAQLER